MIFTPDRVSSSSFDPPYNVFQLSVQLLIEASFYQMLTYYLDNVLGISWQCKQVSIASFGKANDDTKIPWRSYGDAWIAGIPLEAASILILIEH